VAGIAEKLRCLGEVITRSEAQEVLFVNAGVRRCLAM